MSSTVIKNICKKEFKNQIDDKIIQSIFDDLCVLLEKISKKQNGSFIFTNNIDYLDRCWHQFILHTKEYHQFCINSAGEYIHHTPEEQSSESSGSNSEEILEAQFNWLSEELGYDFSFRIYFLYPEILKGYGL